MFCDMSERTVRLLITGSFVLFAMFVGAMYAHCERQYERRVKCLESGRSGTECEHMYPIAGRG